MPLPKPVAILPILALFLLVGCGEEGHHPSDGASVARICRDGSHIFKYSDGTYHTSWEYVVDDIEKVCAQ